MVYPALLPLVRTALLPVIELNWLPRGFKWTRPFRRKTKSGFYACAITFQLAPTSFRNLIIFFMKGGCTKQETSRTLDTKRKKLLVLAHKSVRVVTLCPINGLPLLITVTIFVDSWRKLFIIDRNDRWFIIELSFIANTFYVWPAVHAMENSSNIRRIHKIVKAQLLTKITPLNF